MEYKKDQATENAQTERQKDLLEAQKFAMDADVRRFEIFAAAMKRVPELGAAEDFAAEAREDVLRAARKATRTQVAGSDIGPDVARALTSHGKSEQDPGRLDGVFNVRKVDTTAEDGFRVQLQEVETGETFLASVRDVLLSDRDRQLIRQGEWDKIPVEARVNVVRKNGRIIDAVIERVERVVPPQADGADEV